MAVLTLWISIWATDFFYVHFFFCTIHTFYHYPYWISSNSFLLCMTTSYYATFLINMARIGNRSSLISHGPFILSVSPSPTSESSGGIEGSLATLPTHAQWDWSYVQRGRRNVSCILYTQGIILHEAKLKWESSTLRSWRMIALDSYSRRLVVNKSPEHH